MASTPGTQTEQEQETLFSILTTERWLHNDITSFIVFQPNGTGHLLFGGDAAPSFVRGFDWKALNAPALEEIINVPTSNSTRILAHLSLEITITNYDPFPEYYGERNRPAVRTEYNDLNEEGMLPKTYTVRLESGRFPMPYMMDLYGKEDFLGFPGSRLRLAFDKSPYRPWQEWKGNRGGLVDMKRGDPVIFVARKIKENTWDNCVVI
ncbi:unnamed protein product [Penicillium pancosmium]